jgi:heterodisulfide reductase subunit C/quinone-modifying oxidoreductase subunit QmoC
MTRCPQEVHITDLMYTLKRMAIREGFSKESSASDVPGFSQSFIGFVENYGRSFELGLATRYLNPPPSLKYTRCANGLVDAQRAYGPNTQLDKGVNELKAILNRAKQLEEEEYAL